MYVAGLVCIILYILRTGLQITAGSTDNVRSELVIDRTNPWIAGHVVRSFTDSFREILIFNYLIITRDNIHVSEEKLKNE